MLDYLTDDSLVVEVWGTQKDEGFKSGAASDKNKLTTKDLMSRERSGLGMSGAGGAAAATGGAAAAKKVSTLLNCNKNASLLFYLQFLEETELKLWCLLQ